MILVHYYCNLTQQSWPLIRAVPYQTTMPALKWGTPNYRGIARYW